MAREHEEAPEFDSVASGYDDELNKGLALTGESKEYFAEGRMRRVAQLLEKKAFQPKTALDFGCGTGGSTALFFRHLGCETVLGVDPSEKSLEVARKAHEDKKVTFSTQSDPRITDTQVDIAFCNGVFHHIPPAEREDAMEFIFGKVRSGGMFAFWENNAWNPMTRYLMSRVPFDKDAVLLFPKEARRLLTEAGFKIATTEFHFVFPKLLAFCRFMEPAVRKLPLGGQYLVLVQKP